MRGRGLIYLELTIHVFEPPSSDLKLMFSFQYWWQREGSYAELFSKHQSKDHFLLWNRIYVYKERDIPNEAWYQKGQLKKFVINLGYIGGGILVDEVDKMLEAHY